MPDSTRWTGEVTTLDIVVTFQPPNGELARCRITFVAKGTLSERDMVNGLMAHLAGSSGSVQKLQADWDRQHRVPEGLSMPPPSSDVPREETRPALTASEQP